MYGDYSPLEVPTTSHPEGYINWKSLNSLSQSSMSLFRSISSSPPLISSSNLISPLPQMFQKLHSTFSFILLLGMPPARNSGLLTLRSGSLSVPPTPNSHRSRTNSLLLSWRLQSITHDAKARSLSTEYRVIVPLSDPIVHLFMDSLELIFDRAEIEMTREQSQAVYLVSCPLGLPVKTFGRSTRTPSSREKSGIRGIRRVLRSVVKAA